MRVSYEVKASYGVVWFDTKVPWWVFILWLAMQNKLNTLDRLLKWGVVSCDSQTAAGLNPTAIYFLSAHSLKLYQQPC